MPTATVEKRLERLEETAKVIELVVEKALDNAEIVAQRPGAPAVKANLEYDTALRSFLKEGGQGLTDVQVRTLTSGTPSAGGYTVIPEYSRTIIEGIQHVSPMRSLANVITISTDHIFLPKMTTPLNGGWVTETGSRPSSEPVFDQQRIDVYEQAVIVPMSQKLVDDSFVNLPSYISGQISQRFARTESIAFTNGDGNGKPTGFLHDPDDFEQVEASQTVGPAFLEKLIDLFYQLPAEYAANSNWQMTRKTMGVIRKLADLSDAGTLWSDSLANGEPARFLGRPVTANEFMDQIENADSPPAATYPVALGDFKAGYTIVDRLNLEFLNDPFTGADNGIWKLRARRRTGGAVVLPEAIQVLKATP
jgi:HK97 family phage major capsid protein